ncbi:MAG: hypothetical protein VKJ64_21075 [Leptolyngbyaceae bacterium]|nr:hypothetical protein [Leptolyngbyaceae bacterium]
MNTWQSCQDVDAVISSGTAFFGDDVAERLGLPSFIALLQPILPTGAITHPMAPPLHLGQTVNRLTYQCFNRFYWQLFKQSVNEWRQQTPLVSAIQQAVEDTALRQQAQKLGAMIQAEAGVNQAVKIIQAYNQQFWHQGSAN